MNEYIDEVGTHIDNTGSTQCLTLLPSKIIISVNEIIIGAMTFNGDYVEATNRPASISAPFMGP